MRVEALWVRRLVVHIREYGWSSGWSACGQSADRVGARATVAGLLGLTSAGAFALAFARVIVPITVGESGKGRALAL